MAVTTRRALQTALAIAILTLGTFWLYEFIENPANQLFGKTLVSGPANERIVALTFDDGPNPPYTNRILDVLEREDVHATFFVVGQAVRAHPGIVRRESHDGDAIGNHSWSHEHLIMLDAAGLRSSLRRTDDEIYRATGSHTHLMRPPFGARDWLVLDQARRLGYIPVMWSVPLANDWENPPPSVIATRILNRVRDGSIVVLHDGNRGLLCGSVRVPARVCDRRNDIEATRLIVESLKKQGYRFVTVPELLAIKGTMHTPSPGSE